uniref:Ig-like domain-containing protein n=1 Tax=Scleropages formosus TaxID=113540 RepID=A0A8C9VF59_SCLFO
MFYFSIKSIALKCSFDLGEEYCNRYISKLLYLMAFYMAVYDGYFHHNQAECRFTSGDLKDLEYISRYIFNKVEYARFNSTEKRFIGYTESGVKDAERWNQDGLADQTYGDLDAYCRPNAEYEIQNILSHTVEPLVKVKSVRSGSQRHSTMLVCSADGKEVKTDVTSTEELYDGDWYYQIHSYLELTPTSGETIACQVEHSSLPKPKIYNWDPSMSDGERNKVIIGASGLVLGLILSLAGVIYYKKKSTGEILLCCL